MAKKMHIKHAVILVNYNGWRDTLECIESIKKSKDVPHIIVVDNGSSDDSAERIRRKYYDIELIETGKNLGFSGGNNIGIKKALKLGAKVVHILNNDTLVDPNLFSRAYRYVKGKNRIAGGKIYYAKGYEFHTSQKGKGNIIWYAGGYMDWGMALARHYGVDEEDKGQHDKVLDVDFITGCYIAVPKEVFKRIGLLDEIYFLYLEDEDFTLRAIKNGVETKYNPSLVIYHRNSSSTGTGSPLVDYYITKNRFLIAWRYGSKRLFLALIKEALMRNWKSPVRRAALFDFLKRDYGNKNQKIASLSS